MDEKRIAEIENYGDAVINHGASVLNVVSLNPKEIFELCALARRALEQNAAGQDASTRKDEGRKEGVVSGELGGDERSPTGRVAAAGRLEVGADGAAVRAPVAGTSGGSGGEGETD